MKISVKYDKLEKQYVGLVAEFPHLSFFADTKWEASNGIKELAKLAKKVNRITAETFKDTDNGKNIVKHKDVDDMFRDLNL